MCDEENTMPEEEEEMECVCTPKEKPKKRVAVKQDEFEWPCTCPYDPRFPNTNTTRRCFVNFYDYQKCIRLLGDYQGCRIFKLCYKSLCPTEWVKNWEEDIEKGTFACLYPPKPDDLVEPDESENFNTAGY